MRTGKMWRLFPAVLLLLLQTQSGFAQKKLAFTAPQAVEHALKNVTEIRNLKVDREIQLARNKEIRGQAMPQVNGTLSAQYFFNIPVTLLPDFISPAVYGVLEKEGVKNGTGSSIQVPTGPPGLNPVQFGVPWQASAGFSFQQLFFQPDVFVALQARSKSVQYADINIQAMEDSVRSNVYRSYYSVLIAEKRRSFLLDGISRLEKLSRDQEVLYKNGFAERLDIDRTQVNLNNLKSTKSQIDNLVYIGYAALKFSMGLNQLDTLQLTDSLSMAAVKRDILDTTGFNYQDRNEIRLLETVKELQGLDLKRYRLQYLPTVAGFWNYSQNAQRREFNLFDSKQPWFKTNVAGLSVNVPIFDGLQKNYRIRQARLNLEKTENTIENVQRAIDLQRVVSYNTFRNSITGLDIQERNLELAERVYQSTKKKYEQGLGSSFELLQTEQSFEDAQSNYFQALYDATIARISYFRALGRLK